MTRRHTIAHQTCFPTACELGEPEEYQLKIARAMSWPTVWSATTRSALLEKLDTRDCMRASLKAITLWVI